MAVNKGVHRVRERSATSFDSMVPQYFLNTQGELEESPLMKDSQKIIDSAEYTRLDEIYDRMLLLNQRPVVDDGSNEVFEREKLEDRLQLFREVDAIRDEYAVENPDVADMTHNEIYDYINNKVKQQNEKIKEYKEKQKDEKNIEPKGE